VELRGAYFMNTTLPGETLPNVKSSEKLLLLLLLLFSHVYDIPLGTLRGK
jgi:hypothetical protein